MVKTGQRYVSPGGAEMVVTKGGDGTLTDGDVELQPKGSEAAFAGAGPGPEGPAFPVNLENPSPCGSLFLRPGLRRRNDDHHIRQFVNAGGTT